MDDYVDDKDSPDNHPAAFGLLAAVAAISWYHSLHSPAATSQIDPSVHIGGPFTLVDTDGRPVTEAALKGKWTAVFFGYTYCPDVCPLTLQNLAATQRKLGDKAKDLHILFITVDPARDTPQALKTYLASAAFPAGVTGLSGTQAQVDVAEKAYRAVPQRFEKDGSYYFSHTAVIYLMDPKGEFNTPLTADMTPQQNADQIRQAMRGG
ncbi:MAG: SCO family protein [Asticcacaulis sp.]